MKYTTIESKWYRNSNAVMHAQDKIIHAEDTDNSGCIQQMRIIFIK